MAQITVISGSERRRVWSDAQKRELVEAVSTPGATLGKGLFEVRTFLPDGTIARVLFCFHKGELYALHGFIKKSQ